MTSPSIEERIIFELTRRGTCSLLDLKSALRLSRGDIIAITNHLAEWRVVRIEKDRDGEPFNYIWTGPKEYAREERAFARGVASSTVSRVRKPSLGKSLGVKPRTPAPDPIPADWKQPIEKFALGLSSRPEWKQRHSKEQEKILQLIQRKEVEQAATLIWKASRKVSPNWSASEFRGYFQDVICRLAIHACVPTLTITDIRARVKALEVMRDRELFVRNESAREELDRAILDLRRMEQNTSKTKPEFQGPRLALKFLHQSFRYHLKKPLHRAVGLLMRATFDREWGENTVQARASEWASSGLMKPTAANMTRKKFAAIDKLEGEEKENAIAKMSPKLLELYLKS